MNNTLKLLTFITILFTTMGCYRFVEPGHEAVKVWVAGSETGKQEVLPAGRYWSTYRTTYYDFPIFEQTVQYRGSDAFEFTIQGLRVTMEIGASYRVSDTETLFRRYRSGVNEINNTHLRNIIRDALNNNTRTLSMEDVYGEEANRMMERVFEVTRTHLEAVGIELTGIYMIGRPAFPPEVDRAIEERIKASQQAEQREIQRREAIAQAEIDRERARGETDAVVIRARGEAEAIREVTRALTPVYVEYLKSQRWNGETPRVVGAGGMIIDLGNTVNK
jgi:uncharacterized membrane protein YqiK